MAAALQFIPVHTAEQIDTVAALAREVWYEYYVPLIGRSQVDYMVEHFQSAPAMRRQIAEGYEYFLIQSGTTDVGYLAVQPRHEERALFLSKLYLVSKVRGQGGGRTALAFIDTLARDRRLERVYLTVNKGNPSRSMYERCGYVRTADLVIDIGGGFVMDDYRMEKFLI